MNTRSGFTLVEIMITVAIIGLLAGLGIPAFNKARTNSIQNARESNVRLINNAVEMWAMDAFVADGTPIDPAITNYIKGGFDGLKVGEQEVALTNITSYAVGHTFTPEDLYDR